MRGNRPVGQQAGSPQAYRAAGAIDVSARTTGRLDTPINHLSSVLGNFGDANERLRMLANRLGGGQLEDLSNRAAPAPAGRGASPMPGNVVARLEEIAEDYAQQMRVLQQVLERLETL